MTTHTIDLRFKKLKAEAKVPSYESQGAVGADLSACLLPEGNVPSVYDDHRWGVLINPGKMKVISTGIAIELPPFYEAQIRIRSSLGKMGLIIPNAPGTIDWDYRGEIKVMLYNLSEQQHMIMHGQRIAQLVIAPVVRGMFHEAAELSTTRRDAGGFGSTGV